ncbi:hypothetical protein YC2023_045149 [Brassica napus]
MWRHPFTAGFLEGLWPFRPRKFEAITGLSLQLLVFNEEFLVSASHQLALTTSLPFVHTARRSYRLNDPVKCSDRGDVGGSPSATSREVNLRKDHCRTLETERPENDETSLFGRPVSYCACRFRGYAFIHGQDFSFGWIVRIASGYHQTPARKVSRKIQLNSLLSPTRRRCLFGSSAAM